MKCVHILTIVALDPSGVRPRYIQFRLLPRHEHGLTAILKPI